MSAAQAEPPTTDGLVLGLNEMPAVRMVGNLSRQIDVAPAGLFGLGARAWALLGSRWTQLRR